MITAMLLNVNNTLARWLVREAIAAKLFLANRSEMGSI